MMQELRIHRWCDVCFRESGSYVDAVNTYGVSISVSGRRALERKLETCDVHAKPVEDMRELLKEAGISPDVPPRTVETNAPAPPRSETKPEVKSHPKGGTSGSRPTNCPVCQERLTRHAVVGHLLGVHGAKRIKHPTKCPDCGERHEGANSMATHRRKTHGFSTLDAMAATVKGAK